MSSQRYRIFLVEDAAGALVPARGRRRSRHTSPTNDSEFQESLLALNALLSALRRVNRRGSGPAAWAPVAHDPLTFLLDTMSDALLVRGLNGEIVYANSWAQRLQLERRDFTNFEEFEQDGESYHSRGLLIQLPQGQLTFTLVTRARR